MSNTKIEQFIADTSELNPVHGEIVSALRTVVREVNPDAEEGFKYGGIVFNRDSDLITGIFVRKAHISLEFSYGAGFDDPKKILEGTGKLRRHIKIRELGEIETKGVREFVENSFA